MTKTTLYQNRTCLTLCLLASINTVLAHNQTSSSYAMSKDVLSNGGNWASSLNYQRVSTIGQPATKRGVSDNLILQAGFHHPSLSPAACKIYAVNDKGKNNSQLFTINFGNLLEINKLGPQYDGHDIEALVIHPETNKIFAASGDNATNGNNGHFYTVDGQTGQLISVGSTGFNEIEDMAFGPDKKLWAWAKGQGLITIHQTTGVGTLEFPSEVLVEGLTLSKEPGRMVFYGSANTALWAYDRDAETLDVNCTNLLGETEALEMIPNGIQELPDGFLLVGTHNVSFGLHALHPETCEIIVADETLSHQFTDVEGIALPTAACAEE